MLESVYDRDLPMLQAIALVSAAIYVVCNLAPTSRDGAGPETATGRRTATR